VVVDADRGTQTINAHFVLFWAHKFDKTHSAILRNESPHRVCDGQFAATKNKPIARSTNRLSAQQQMDRHSEGMSTQRMIHQTMNALHGRKRAERRLPHRGAGSAPNPWQRHMYTRKSQGIQGMGALPITSIQQLNWNTIFVVKIKTVKKEKRRPREHAEREKRPQTILQQLIALQRQYWRLNTAN